MSEAPIGVDVAVIGGGILGLSVANAVAEEGLAVASIFPNKCPERPPATLAAGAMLGAFGETTADEVDGAALALRVRAQRIYPEWLAGIAERAGLPVKIQQGTFVVANASSRTDSANIARIVESAYQYDESVEAVEPEDIPGFSPNPEFLPTRSVYLSGEGSIDVALLLRALRRSLVLWSSWRHVNSCACALRPEGESWRISTRAGTSVVATTVVVCAGSRSRELIGDDLAAAAGLPDMRFGKGVSCLVAAPQSRIVSTIRTPNRAFACGIPLVPRHEGAVYIGATNIVGRDHEAELHATPGELHNLFDEVLHQLDTGLRDARILSFRVGFRPLAADGWPLIGGTGLPGLLMATGTYRNGVLLAPLASAVVADAISGRTARVDEELSALGHASQIDREALIAVGVRHLVAMLQEPRGHLPYARADELERYLLRLFRMAVDPDDAQNAALRLEILRRLKDEPVPETMNRLFYAIADAPALEPDVQRMLPKPDYL
jgi:glycine/D-amino acid oxidase-like deaminating enzyme